MSKFKLSDFTYSYNDDEGFTEIKHKEYDTTFKVITAEEIKDRIDAAFEYSDLTWVFTDRFPDMPGAYVYFVVGGNNEIRIAQTLDELCMYLNRKYMSFVSVLVEDCL